MIRDPNSTAARIARKLARFRRAGLEPVCIDCRCADPELLELDHRYGRRNEPILEVRCKYCHKRKHEQFRQEEIGMRREPDADTRHAMYLRNLAISYENQAPILRQMADEIENRKKR